MSFTKEQVDMGMKVHAWVLQLLILVSLYFATTTNDQHVLVFHLSSIRILLTVYLCSFIGKLYVHLDRKLETLIQK